MTNFDIMWEIIKNLQKVTLPMIPLWETKNAFSAMEVKTIAIQNICMKLPALP